MAAAKHLATATLLAFLAAYNAPDPTAVDRTAATPVTTEATPSSDAGPVDAPLPQSGESKWLEPPVATRRHALVFGNGAYGHGDALAMPAADATMVAEALRERGYQVLLALDRGAAAMRDDLRTFRAMSEDADLRVLYFAGHGFEFDNANYLMPVDLPAGIDALDRDAVRLHGLQLDTVARELDAGAGAVVAIIDSCRVLPTRGAAGTRTLVAQDVPDGMILAYATAPGQVASDSLRAYGIDQDHSPYSYFLANELRTTGDATWDQVLMAAGNIVKHRTRGAQQPWWNANIDRFPAVGLLPGQAASRSPGGPFGKLMPSAERRAASRYWAEEDLAAAWLAQDGSVPDAELEARAAKGDARATLALSQRWWDDPARKDAIPALLEPLAENGNAVAQCDLGTYLYSIRGADREGRTARHWWQLASAQGIGEARMKLVMLDGGNTEEMMNEYIRGVIDFHEVVETRLGIDDET